MNNCKIFDILIIGSGPAGLFAGFQACSSNLSVCIIETLSIHGGQCSILYPEKPIYDIPGHIKISGMDLVENLKKQLEKFEEKSLFIFDSEAIEYKKDENNIFKVITSKGQELYSKTILIASGGGSFIPNKPQVENLEYFEKHGMVQYLINDSKIYSGKKIAIAGGGDSAVDWAISLSKIAEKIFFIHRRSGMKCHQSSLNELYNIAETTGKIEFKIPYVVEKLEIKPDDSSKIQMTLRNFDDENKFDNIEIDYFLPFFGLKNEIGSIKNWGLEFSSKRKIIVDNFMKTNICGIFGAGDIVQYDGKTKLLVSCFHEASVCINSIEDYLEEFHGRKKETFAYSTTKFQ